MGQLAQLVSELFVWQSSSTSDVSGCLTLQAPVLAIELRQMLSVTDVPAYIWLRRLGAAGWNRGRDTKTTHKLLDDPNRTFLCEGITKRKHYAACLLAERSLSNQGVKELHVAQNDIYYQAMLVADNKTK